MTQQIQRKLAKIYMQVSDYYSISTGYSLQQKSKFDCRILSLKRNFSPIKKKQLRGGGPTPLHVVVPCNRPWSIIFKTICDLCSSSCHLSLIIMDEGVHRIDYK